MAFDELLAERVRSILAREAPHVRERRMFGGLALLVDGHMVCGVVGDELILRLGEEAADAALDEPHVRPMDFTGRPMRTMVFIGPPALASDRALEAWVLHALAHIRKLPPKP
jgi:TfoX/Sxy family transcriptional regulator of competence genes